MAVYPGSAPTTSHPLEADDVLAGPVVDVAGLALQLMASDRIRAGAVAALFRHAVLANAPARCTLRFTADEVVCPTAEPTTVIDDVEVWRPEPDQLWLRSGAGLTAHVSPAEIVVGGTTPHLAAHFRFMGFIALTHLLAQHGRQVLHAGAFVADDEAILVLGDTGTGKSTLVFSALQLGWGALSDDMVAVHRRDGVVHAVGLPRPISVPADVFAAEMPGTRPVPEDARRRTELPASSLTIGEHPVTAIVVTSHGSIPDAVIEPMRGHEVLRVVLSASTSLIDPAIFPEVFAIAGALARTPTWSLAHGSDPVSRIDAAARQLEVLRRRLREGRAS